MNEHTRRELLADAARRFEIEARAGLSDTFLPWIDGRPVAAGTATYTDAAVVLNGGSTIPTARGRGAYRALVRARWDEAARRGTPAVVTQAGRMSAPILEKLGFQTVARIQILLDRVS